jgi:endonuclease G, mitochondrial
MSFDGGYLTRDEIKRLHKALIDANLASVTAQVGLRSTMLREYAVRLPENGFNPSLMQFGTLNMMNLEHNLRNGDVPLEQYLSAALIVAGSSSSAEVIDEMIGRIRYSGGPPPATAAAIAAAAPTGQEPLVASASREVNLEAQTNAFDQTVSVRFLSDGLRAARSVVKILVQRFMNGEGEFLDGDRPLLVNGTGWFIAPGLLITNHHVVNARRKEGIPEPDATAEDFASQADSAALLFDYLAKLEAPDPVALGKGALVCADQALDFAILRVAAEKDRRPPLALRVHPIRKTLQQALGTGVNLLQHPYGNPMRLGFRNNYVIEGTADTLSYLTDTAVGSSGSPVCDDSWAVAALHSGSRRIADQGIEILGHKFARENYGTPIAAIMAHLASKQPDVAAEVRAAQQAGG